MENLQLIMVTVLITLISGALVGSLIYLGVVVRKLRRTVKDNVVDITNLQNTLNEVEKNINNRIDELMNDVEDKFEKSYDSLNHQYHELDRKIDSRYDKLGDNIHKDIEMLRQTKTK
jgi:DNA-binding transcriptional regulator GbsR (MarR family)